MRALIFRVFAFALVRRWTFRRDSEITSSSQVGEQVTVMTLVSTLKWIRREDAPKPPSNRPSRFCHVQ